MLFWWVFSKTDFVFSFYLCHLSSLLSQTDWATVWLPCLLSTLCSSREVEEELEVVWQTATRQNQQMKDTLLDSRLTADLHGWPVSGSAYPGWPSQAPDETTSSPQNQPLSSELHLFTSHQSPGLQIRSVSKSDSDHPNNSLDEKQKHGLDFYC